MNELCELSLDNEFLAVAFASIGDGVVATDTFGKVLFLNKTAQILTGWSIEDANGKNFEEIFNLINVKSREHIDNPIKFTIENNTVSGLKNQTGLISKTGEERIISASVSPINKGGLPIGAVVVFRDITQIKSAEELVIQKEMQQKAILENVPDMVWLKDRESRYIVVNESFLRTNKVEEKDVIGKNDFEIWRDELAEKHLQDDKDVIKRGQTRYFDEIVAGRDGFTGYIEIVRTPIFNVGGDVTGIAGIARDVAERKLMENALLMAKEDAEAANHAKGEFLANMSHEIRTPLHGISGMLELVAMSDITEEQRKYLTMGKTCCSNLLNLINDILDFSKIEAGKVKIEKSIFDIKELLERKITMHRIMAQKKGIALEFDNTTLDIAKISGDAGKVEQILDNIIGNAIKFTFEGEVRLRVHQSIKPNGKREIHFSVSDTGIGIAREEMDLLFKIFSQVDSSFTKKAGGTGLGLAIAKGLVEMMGGEIWVESSKGEGTIFYFTIPFETVGEFETNIQAENVKQSSKKTLTILVADDDLVCQSIVTNSLKMFGHKVIVSNDGQEALDRFVETKFDLVLMDVQMAKMNGVQAVKRIREIEKETNTHVPIIALTAYALKDDRQRFLNAGMDEYLQKPFKINELVEKIDCLLKI